MENSVYGSYSHIDEVDEDGVKWTLFGTALHACSKFILYMAMLQCEGIAICFGKEASEVATASTPRWSMHPSQPSITAIQSKLMSSLQILCNLIC